MLNTIDQTGFFDYDPTTYSLTDDNSPVMGTGSIIIEVNAWRSKSISHYALWVFMREDPPIWDSKNCGYPCPPPPVIAPSLRTVYELLWYLNSAYQSIGLHVYKPDRLAIWIYSVSEPIQYNHDGSWPLQSLPLKDLHSRSPCTTSPSAQDKTLVLRGSEAEAVYGISDDIINNTGGIYIENAKEYQVFARPLFPYEAVPSCAGGPMPPIPAPDVPQPSTTLECKPSDGLFQPDNR